MRGDAMTFAPVPVLTGDAARAVSHQGSHLQIVASAGAGKTEVVAQRVAYLLESGVEPGGIVAFTFTERAAESLKARIESRVAERLGETFLDRMNGCFVGTIHSYCFRLLQLHQSEYETYDVLDDHRLAAFITRVSAQLDIKSLASDGKLFNGIREFLANVEVVDNELLDVDDLENPFRATVEQFHALLHQYRFLTYGRMVAVAVRALARPDVFEAAHGPLRHLIVDEYQDVNPAQEALIQRMAEPPVELCVVGDDDQSIYQWRGADVKNIVSFAERYDNVARFTLSTNRRSRPGIIDVANQVSSRIAERLDKEMVSDREGGPTEVVRWAAPTETDEAQRIASNVLRLRQLGYRFGEVAVLVRGRVSYPRLLEALQDVNIPVAPGGRTALFLAPEAQLFGRTFAWLADTSWREQAWGYGQDDTVDTLLEQYAARFELGARNTWRIATTARRVEGGGEGSDATYQPRAELLRAASYLRGCRLGPGRPGPGDAPGDPRPMLGDSRRLRKCAPPITARSRDTRRRDRRSGPRLLVPPVAGHSYPELVVRIFRGIRRRG